MNQDQFSVYLVSLKTLDNQALIDDILQKYYEQIEARTRQLLNYFAQISLLGPISFISPQLSQQNKQYHDKLVHIRQDYEMLIGTYEQKFRENINFTKEYIQNFVNHYKNSVGDENYLAYINDQINQDYTINLDQENWINYMSQLIDVQTIQEINQTQILYVSDSDKKIAFNYDGDEEKTPIQSEQEYQEKQNNKVQTYLIQYIKKKQDKNEDNLSEKDGYDASNSDHSKNKSKTTRALRIQRKKNQNPNAEFDTDRERGNKKS